MWIVLSRSGHDSELLLGSFSLSAVLIGCGKATNPIASSLHADNSDGGGASDDLINQINVHG